MQVSSEELNKIHFDPGVELNVNNFNHVGGATPVSTLRAESLVSCCILMEYRVFLGIPCASM